MFHQEKLFTQNFTKLKAQGNKLRLNYLKIKDRTNRFWECGSLQRQNYQKDSPSLKHTKHICRKKMTQ